MAFNLSKFVAKTFFASAIQAEVRAAFAAETDATFNVGASQWGASDRDRYTCDRETVLGQSLEAWRVNPLARRIVELTSQYVVGGGVAFTCKHEPTASFLNKFWGHPLNRMPVRITELCDELTRTGNLFLLLTTDASGMTYLRAVPALQVKEINAAENDIEHPLSFTLKSSLSAAYKGEEENVVPAYDPHLDTPDEQGCFPAVMLHYAINRPVGAQWGEPDLAPLLRWLSRYANWLEDRARLNRFRTAFLYIVKGKFISEAERITRQSQLNACPPNPGSILVTNESETWDVISPKLESNQANEDGLALKKMIAAGAGFPLHFLAEPESSTRTTAEAAGGPTFRRFEQRQRFFTWLLQDLLAVAVRRRALVDHHVSISAPIEVQAADISSRDNVSLAMATMNIFGVLKDLRDRKLVDDAELLRLVYRFAGEVVDVEEMLERGKTSPDPVLTGESVVSPPSSNPSRGGPEPMPRQDAPVDPETGEDKSIN